MANMRKCILHAMQKVNILSKQNQFRIPASFRESFRITFALLEFGMFTICNEKVYWKKHYVIFAYVRCTLV